MGNLTGMINPDATPQQDMGAWPTGEYLVEIVASDVKPTQQNNGQFAELEYVGLEGPMQGRRLWTRITLENANDKAVEIGQRQLASLREATGVANPTDTADFHKKPHLIRVEFYPVGSVIAYGKKKGEKRDRDENEIKAWKKVDAAAASAQAAPTAGASKSAPWKPRAQAA